MKLVAAVMVGCTLAFPAFASALDGGGGAWVPGELLVRCGVERKRLGREEVGGLSRRVQQRIALRSDAEGPSGGEF